MDKSCNNCLRKGIVESVHCEDCMDYSEHVPISGYNDVMKNDKFTKIYESLLKMQQAKDKAYGNAALKPLDIFAKHHHYGSRLDEKLARVKNCEELRKNDVADLICGLILICSDKGWDNFDNLID